MASPEEQRPKPRLMLVKPRCTDHVELLLSKLTQMMLAFRIFIYVMKDISAEKRAIAIQKRIDYSRRAKTQSTCPVTSSREISCQTNVLRVLDNCRYLERDGGDMIYFGLSEGIRHSSSLQRDGTADNQACSLSPEQWKDLI